MSLASGALVGLVAGSGLALAVARLPVLRRPTLKDRVEPYLRDVVGEPWSTADRPQLPLTTLGRLTAPYVDAAARRLGRLLGGTASVRRRLLAAGSTHSVQDFRVQQVLTGALGLGIAVVASLIFVAAGVVERPWVLLVLCGIGVVMGVLGRDYALSRAVEARERRMIVELPVVTELLALAVGAGEGPTAALERVARSARGELAYELERALGEARTGTPLAIALESMSDRVTLPPLRRFVEGFIVAVERGTPLADVLRVQAEDVREAGRRELLEQGGRREVAMLVPVVFGILPVTVLFALFPAFFGLSVIAR